MTRYKIIVEYDGSDLIGWQENRQGSSVQSILRDAIEKFCGERPDVVAAGRTDAGVHAIIHHLRHAGHPRRLDGNPVGLQVLVPRTRNAHGVETHLLHVVDDGLRGQRGAPSRLAAGRLQRVAQVNARIDVARHGHGVLLHAGRISLHSRRRLRHSVLAHVAACIESQLRRAALTRGVALYGHPDGLSLGGVARHVRQLAPRLVAVQRPARVRTERHQLVHFAVTEGEIRHLLAVAAEGEHSPLHFVIRASLKAQGQGRQDERYV